MREGEEGGGDGCSPDDIKGIYTLLLSFSSSAASFLGYEREGEGSEFAKRIRRIRGKKTRPLHIKTKEQFAHFFPLYNILHKYLPFCPFYFFFCGKWQVGEFRVFGFRKVINARRPGGRRRRRRRRGRGRIHLTSERKKR